MLLRFMYHTFLHFNYEVVYGCRNDCVTTKPAHPLQLASHSGLVT